jgi:hypothetical protein
MTSVNVTKTTTTVDVTEGGQTAVVSSQSVSVVSAITAGPQGPVGPSGLEVDSTAKVNGSVVYYDGSEFKADATWTTSTLTFGGNF